MSKSPRSLQQAASWARRTIRKFLGLRVEELEDRTAPSVGDLLQARQFGSSDADYIHGVAGDGQNTYVAGTTFAALPGQTFLGARDAYVRKYDSSGAVVWTRQFGTSTIDQAFNVTVYSGGVYLAGETHGTLPGQTFLGGINDGILVKYDLDGNLLWTRHIGTGSDDETHAVAADATGVYVGGYVQGTLAGQSNAGGRDAFIQKYDHSGSLLWTRQFGSSGWDVLEGITIHATGIYVSGNANGALPGQTYTGDSDMFVRKYDAAGTEQWTKQFGTSAFDGGYDRPAVDDTGVYVAGETAGTFPGQTLFGARDAVVRKYAHDGTLAWTRQFGTSGSEEGPAAFAGATGLYIALDTTGAFPGQTNAGQVDLAVSRFDSSGNEIWTRQLGTSANDRMTGGLSVDGRGIHLGGYTLGTFAGQSAVSGSTDALLVTLSNTPADGDFVWKRQFGSSGSSEEVEGLASDGAYTYAVGATGGAIDGQNTSGGVDAFLRKTAANGTLAWTKQFGTPGTDITNGVAIHSSGIYVSGLTTGNLQGTGQGGLDAFLRKYDASGNVLWTQQLGTAGTDYAVGVAVDASGVYLYGQSDGNLAGANVGAEDLFVVKYDHNGNLVAQRQFGTNFSDTSRGIAVHSAGVYLTGATNGTFPGQSFAGSSDVFVARLEHDLDFDPAWTTQQFGTTGTDEGFGVATDDSGVYVTGVVGGTLPGQTGAGSDDAYVRKYTHAGAVAWTRQFGTSSEDWAQSVSTFGDGVFLGVKTGGSLGGPNAGDTDIVARKYTRSGDVAWTKQIGTSDTDNVYAIVADANAVTVGGLAKGALFGQTNAGFADPVLIAFANSRTVTWTNPAGGDWHTPSNWDLGVVPTTGDRVVIPDLGAAGPNLTITYSTGATSVLSVVASENLTLSGGTLTVTETATLGDAVTLAGGQLAGAATTSVRPTNGLVAHWRAAGDALDAVGSNHGTPMNGATFTAGRMGPGLDFDGVNDAVRFGDMLDNVFAGAGKKFSFSIWAKVDTVRHSVLIGKMGDGAVGPEDQRQFVVAMETDGSLYMLWNGALAGGSQRAVRTTTQLAVGTWYHIGVTYDSTINTNDGLDRVTIYFNGVAQPKSLVYVGGSLGDIQNGTANLAIGAAVATNLNAGYFFDGQLDEVAVYDRVLSAAEIQALAAPVVNVQLVGRLTSNATVNGDVANAGTVAPGNSPGIITINGNYSQSGALAIEIQGTNPATPDYDQLVVNGVVTLGGALNVDLINNFMPTVGNSFQIITNDGSDPVVGTFAGLAQGAYFIADHVTFQISYSGGTGNDVVLTVARTPFVVTNTGDAVGDLLQVAQFGSSALEEASSIARIGTDLYVLGHTDGALPGETNLGLRDVFLRKYDSTGALVWTRQFGTTQQDHAFGIAASATTIYVVGYTEGAFPGQSAFGGGDAFLQAYDTSGNVLWTRQFGSSAGDLVYGVAVDASGVYVVGETIGTLPTQSSAGYIDAFLSRFDLNGNVVWHRQFGSANAGHDSAFGVTIHASGIYVTGRTSESLSGLPHAGGFDAYARKYDSAGVHHWTRQFGTNLEDYSRASVVDGSGVYVFGETLSSLGGASAGGRDVFLRKYDPSGNSVWLRQHGTAGNDFAGGIVLDAGVITTSGSTTGAYSGETNAGGLDLALTRYDLGGNILWNQQVGTPADDVARGSILATTDTLYVAGSTKGAFASNTNVGSDDAFVANFANSTAGTLRQALLDANATANLPGVVDQIIFTIPGAGPHTLTPLSALPTITDTVVIDGYTEAGSSANTLAQGSNAVLMIELNGASAGAGTIGLWITSANSVVRGLAINRFGGSGIYISGAGATGNVIAGNFIGTNVTGTAGLGNTDNGIAIFGGAHHNWIGTNGDGVDDLAERNVLSGNLLYGVGISDAGTNSNVVAGNLIGVNAAGTAAIGNTYNGVAIFGGAKFNRVGTNADGLSDVAERNIISGNVATAGVLIVHSGTEGNVVAGNYIGTDVTGTAAIGNGVGVAVDAANNTIGGTTAAARNVLSGNIYYGVFLNTALTTGTVVAGNYIGTDATGTVALGNDYGVVIANGASGNVLGGTSPGAGNLISGNAFDGVHIASGSTNNTVAGNLIGTNATGTAALGNQRMGVLIVTGASNNTIGGTTAAARNIISGNGQAATFSGGVYLFDAGTTGNVVQGNYIGTDITGTAMIGNAWDGVALNFGATGNTIGGTTPGAGNIISGNGWHGVEIDTAGTSNNTILGNIIGLAADGSGLLGNAHSGVTIGFGANNNTIGGSSAAARNVISGNAVYGVLLFDIGTSGNVVLGNFIGTDLAGTAARGNVVDGVRIEGGASGNTVGGAVAGATNIISGNGGDGVNINGAGSSGNVVAANWIGISSTGAPLGNLQAGIRIAGGAANTSIGVAGAGNIIGGNSGAGVYISDAGTTANTLIGNWIGLGPAGTAAANQQGGVTIQNGASGNMIGVAGAGNIISANGNNGVLISGVSGTVVRGNSIGTDATGTIDLGNVLNGVQIEGGASNSIIGGAGAGNLISGNNQYGVRITGSGTTGNQLLGNFIGTNAAGTGKVGNSLSGVRIDTGASGNTVGGTAAADRNVISGNGDSATGGRHGVLVDGAGTNANVILGNFIGVDATGNVALGNFRQGIAVTTGATNTVIGGTAAGAGNVISANTVSGVYVQNSTGTVIKGNLIGVGADGTTALGNGLDGVTIENSATTTVGGAAAGARNVISANAISGVRLLGSSTGSLIQGNYLGTDASGNLDLGNVFYGVSIDSGPNGNTIGGTGAGEGNIISGNDADGVNIYQGYNNLIVGNLIGRDAANTANLGNGDGIEINNGWDNTIGGVGAGAGNTISGNGTGINVYVDTGLENSIGGFAGTDGLKTTGQGRTVMLGGNTYTGATTITGGEVRIAGANGIGDTSAVTIDSTATLDLNSFNESIGSLAGAGSLKLGSGTLTVGDASDTTFGGVISGSGSIIKVGAGQLTLSGANTYTGTTTVQGGTLVAASNAALGSAAGGTTVSGTGLLSIAEGVSIAEPLTINAGRMAVLQDAASTTGTIALAGTLAGRHGSGANGTITLTSASAGFSVLSSPATFVIAGAILDGVSSFGVTIFTSGSGAQLQFTNTGNAYDGATHITGTGRFILGDHEVVPNTSAVIVDAGATWNLGGANETIASLSGGGTIMLNSGTLTVGDASNTTFSGELSETGAVVKQGSGQLTLNGTNSFSGTMTVMAGTLVAASNAALGSPASGTIVSGTGLLSVAAGVSIAEPLTINPGRLVVLQDGAVSTGAVNLAGTLAGRVGSVASGAITLTGGSAGFTMLSSPGVFTIAGAITDGASTFGVTVLTTGSGAIIRLTNPANTYDGATLVTGPGALELGAAGVLPNGTAVTVDTGSTLDLAGFNETIGSLAGSGSVLLGAGTLTTGNASDTTFGGVISGTGNLVKQGGGQLTLSGANTYTGTTTVQIGTLAVSNSAGLGDAAGGTTVTFGVLFITAGITTAEPVTVSGGFFILDDNVIATGSINLAGNLFGRANSAVNGTLTLTSPTALINVQTSPAIFTINGAITDGASSYGLTLSGGSPTVVRLTNSANDYGGATAVTGTVNLELGAAHVLPDTTAVTVNTGATLNLAGFNDTIASLTNSGTVRLGGSTLTSVGTVTSSGSIYGSGTIVAPTLNNTGALAPGELLGAIAITGNYSQTSPGVLTFEIGGATPGTQYDQLTVNGDVSLGGSLLLGLLGGYVPVVGAAYTILVNNGSNPVSGTFTGYPEGHGFTLGGVQVVITYAGGDGNDVQIIANRPPVADAGGPYSIDIGAALVLNASASYDPDPGDAIVSYEWDLDNDSQYDDWTSATAIATVPWLTLQALGLAPGTHVIGLRVTDSFAATGTDTATLTLSNVLVYAAPTNGLADTWTLRKNGTDLQLVQGASTVLVSYPVAFVTAATFTGASGEADDLSLDYAFGGFFALPVTFNGGAGATDRLFVLGGSFAATTHTMTGADAGSLNLSGTTVAYAGVELVQVDSTSTSLLVQFQAVPEAIVLADFGTTTDGLSSIDSAGVDFVFRVPTAALQLNPASGADTVSVTGLDTTFTGNLTLAGVDDSVSFDGSLTLGALIIVAKTIDVNAPLNLVDGFWTANTDVTIDAAITAGAGGFDAIAGRSIYVNANITVNGGNSLTLAANSGTSAGIVDFLRDPGAAVVTMTAGTSLTNTTGTLLAVLVEAGNGLTNSTSGDLAINDLFAPAGHVLVRNLGPSAGSDIVTVNGYVNALSIAFDANGAGGGNVGAANNPMIVTSSTNNPLVEARSTTGDVFITSLTSMTIGSAALGSLNGISAIGTVGLWSNQHLTLSEPLATAGEVILSPSGNVIDGNGSAVNVTATKLSIFAGTTGTVDLDTAIGQFAGYVAGNLTIDEANGLTVEDILVDSGGAVTITSATGDITVVSLTAPSTVTLTASAGAILDGNAAGTVNITAPTLTLSAATGIVLDVLSTTVASASVTGVGGALQIRDLAGGLAVTSATSNNGSINLQADAGALSATSVAAGSGAIDLRTVTSGTVSVGSVTTTGSLVIVSAGNIDELGVDALVDLTAGTLSLTAAGGIGTSSGGAIELDTTTLATATANAGTLFLIDAVNGYTITGLVQAPGAVFLQATETAGTSDTIAINTGGTVRSTSSTVTIHVGDGLTLAAGSTVHSVPSTITINIGSGNTDNLLAIASINGTIQSPSTLVFAGGTGPDSVRILSGAEFKQTTKYTFNGNNGTDQLVIDRPTGTTFTIGATSSTTGNNLGTASTVGFVPGEFTTVESLTGGSGNDSFVFTSSFTMAGVLDGGAGTDTLNYNSRPGGVTINLQAGTATATGGISNLENFIGTVLNSKKTNSDTLIGPDTTNTWTLTGTYAGNLNGTVTFSSMETLTGGAGSDTLVGQNVANQWNLSGANAGNLNATLNFNSMENLTGGSNTDSFNFAGNSRSVAGVVNGGGGTDTLNYTGRSNPVAVNLQAQSASSINGGLAGGLFGIEALVGGSGTDTLTAPDAALNTWNLTATNAGNIDGSFTFSAVENLTGGVNADTFKFTTGTATGVVSGANGPDTVDYSAYSTAIAVNLGAGTATGTGGIDSIEVVRGGTATNDQLTGSDVDQTWTVTGANQGNSSDGSQFFDIELLTGGAGADQFFFAPGGSLAGTVNGGGGTDRLIGRDVNSTWNVTADNAGTLVGVATFATIEELLGGAADDAFVFSNGASVGGFVDGGDGSDTLNYSAYSAVIEVSFQSDTFTSGAETYALANVEVVSGGTATTDKLIGADTAATWTLSALNAGDRDSVLMFAGFERLTGGTSDDYFVFEPAGSVGSTIDGGGGTDTLDYTNFTATVAINLQTATATGTGGFVGIESFVGGNGNDTLTGPNAATTWSLTGVDQGTVNGLAFLSMENLVGGSAADTFSVGAGSLSGSINGGTGTDTLIGGDQINSWLIPTTNNAGTLNGLVFTSVENLTGGADADTFTFGASKSVSGAIAGGGGNDTLDLSAYTTAASVNLQTGAATGATGGITSIESFVGGSASDTFTGTSANTTWTVTGSNVGVTDTGLSFASFENLAGGTGNDMFVFSDGAALTGTLSDGGGVDAVDYSATTGPVTVNLLTGYAGFETLVGSKSASDTLIGTNAASTFTFTSANAGTLSGSITFAGFENYTGGSGGDSFVFAPGGSVTGLLNASGGTDTLDYAQQNGNVTINIGGLSASLTGGISSFETIVGGSGSDTLIGVNVNQTWTITGTNAGTVGAYTFTAVENLTGGTGADTFTFVAGFRTTGTVRGGSGVDTLTGANVIGSWALSSSSGGTVTWTGIGAQMFDQLETLAAGAAADTLTGTNVATTWNVTGTNAGTIAGGVAFTSMGTLVGGTAADTFNLSSGASVAGTLTGGDGTDTLSYSAVTSNIFVNLMTGAATGTAGISGFENVTGGSGADVLIGDEGGNVLIGNNGDDTIMGRGGSDTIQGGQGSNILLGGDGNDTLTAGTGRDLLIGGLDADNLDGGAGDDIVLSGVTIYDDDLTFVGLNDIMTAWRSSKNYDTRVAYVTGPSGGPNTHYLNGSTVSDDFGAPDTLTGGTGRDLFFYALADLFTDWNNGGSETKLG